MRRLSESVWGDLRKKSLGQEVRTEDDIDGYSYEEFLEYIKDTYIPTNRYTVHTFISPTNSDIECIQLCVEDTENGYPVNIYYQRKSKNSHTEHPHEVTISSKIINNHPELTDILEKENYTTTKPPIFYYTITKKNSAPVTKERPKRMTYAVNKELGPLKNSDCVNILDIVLSVIEKPFFVKRTK